MLVSVLIAALALAASTAGQECPSRCLCFRTTVRCMFLQLDRIPRVSKETTILDLRFNRIREVPPGTFSGLTNLYTLLLNNNHITKIDAGAFSGLGKLRYLYLYRNRIKQIDRHALDGLDNLEQLYIHFNEIETLEPDTFANLPSLQRLFLHNNKLARLPPGVFSKIENLKRLRLDSNALICDCQLMWLANMLNDHDETQAAATCMYPATLQGKSVQSISHEEFKCKRPNITTQPSDVEVSFGNTIYLRCQAEGDPDPDIIWYHNSNEIEEQLEKADESHFSVLGDGTLMIENAQHDAMGVYECMARNAVGDRKSRRAVVRHFNEPERPAFTVRPRNINAVKGERVTLECAATGQPEPSISWTKDQSSITDTDRFTVLAKGSLLVEDIKFEDRGVYQCSASNTIQTISASARLNVQVVPTFAELPRDDTVVEGEAITLRCQANGYPQPTITWSKDGRSIPGSRRINIRGAGSALHIADVRPSDAGVYGCRVENNVGRIRASAAVTVTPKVSPTFTVSPTNVDTAVGTQVLLPCSALGQPTPVITWSKDGVQLGQSEAYSISPEGHLTIQNVSLRDSGVYQCEASNSGGVAKMSMLIRVSGVRTYPGDKFVTDSLQQAITDVSRAADNTVSEHHHKGNKLNPSDLLALFRYPSAPARRLSLSNEVYERTLELILRKVKEGYNLDLKESEIDYNDIISPPNLQIIANLSGCERHRRVVNCTDMCFHLKYRTLDGTCNNLQNPMWGASLTPLSRLLPSVYENSFNTPIGWEIEREYNGFKKPSARQISISVMSAHKTTPDEEFTHMLMQWGQFVDHDITFSPMAVSNARFSDGRHCNETCENQSPCFPIKIHEDDPRINRRCMGFTRSSALCGSGMTSIFFNKVTAREQINQITSYIDGSNVYGSSEEEANLLRNFVTDFGLLRTGVLTRAGKSLLPYNVDSPVDCQIDPNKAHIPCFLAGDHRANEQLALLSMHTLWMREHNRIASQLHLLNSHWDSNILYHEARKVVGAQLQHITFTHWLPKVLGHRGMEMLSEFKGYDPRMESGIVNAFSTAAFRFGHSLINPIMFRLNETFQEIPQGHLPLHKAFFAPFRIVEEGGIDPIIRGLFSVAAKKLTSSEFLNLELTEKLFKLAHAVALDLAALNIQRGRDHGLPAYNEYREKCGLVKADTFEDFSGEITSSELRDKLKEVYGHPANVDLFVGGLSETPIDGAKFGPTFRCIIVEQFRRLREGDRFWYENPGVFKPAQLTQIKQSNLARVICDNSDSIQRVQSDVFINTKSNAEYLNCDSDEIPHIDLQVWADCCEDCTQSGNFRSVTGHFRGRRSLDYSYPDQKTDSHQSNDTYNQVYQEGGVVDNDDDYIGKDSHFMMDIMDARIEGIEKVMGKLQRTVRILKKQVKKLNRQLLEKHSCLDDQGRKRQTGDEWKVDECKKCLCKEGYIECDSISCPPTVCEKPIKKPGECCLKC